MSSRRYIKRVHRVPKDRGAVEYFAAIVTKALVKHGWPASYALSHDPVTFGFNLKHADASGDPPPDFDNAAAIAVRIACRTYNVQASYGFGWCGLDRSYTVTDGGHFKELKQ